LEESFAGLISALARTAETRDPYTAGHQRRVATLATAIAKEIGLPEQQIEGIKMAAIVHDIGKIYVPAEILNKPGRLSSTEFDLIKAHSRAGYDILKDIKFDQPIAAIVLQHHERLDGSGYPQGLTEKDIEVGAKILAVTDVVEAITSHRPYRPGLGIDAALDEITKNRGRLYDSDIVDACLNLFQTSGFEFEHNDEF
jgi:putative nucleotidyltransferase with HDIG domain